MHLLLLLQSLARHELAPTQIQLVVDIPIVAWTPASVWHSISDAGNLAGDEG